MTTYKDAGVDIKSTDALVENISELSKSTNRKEILIKLEDLEVF